MFRSFQHIPDDVIRSVWGSSVLLHRMFSAMFPWDVYLQFSSDYVRPKNMEMFSDSCENMKTLLLSLQLLSSITIWLRQISSILSECANNLLYLEQIRCDTNIQQFDRNDFLDLELVNAIKLPDLFRMHVFMER